MNARQFAGTSWSDFQKSKQKFGQHAHDNAEYEREIKERTDRKLNWNIKNRWEQRALDDVYKNTDVRNARYKDFTRMSRNKFNS